MNSVETFNSTFAGSPEISTSAPARVNLIGEHIDYNGGTVLPAALHRRVQVAMAANNSSQFSINSTRFDQRIDRPVGDPKRGDWTDYAIGALNKAHELGWLKGGANLQIESDIPDGAGVSSSAALITAILRATSISGGSTPTPVDIAKHARAVENDYIGMPCGIMDQMAVGLADEGKALALDTSDLTYEVIDIPADWTFVVLHSGVRRELSDGRYKARFEECEQARKILNAQYLCRLNGEQLKMSGDLPKNLAKRVRHVMSEHQRTLAAIKALKVQDIENFGRLMIESHRSYAHQFEASTPEIDVLVDASVELGACGARLTGGGFGGCIVALIKTSRSEAWTRSVLDKFPDAWRV